MLPESSPSTRGPGIATPASSLPSDIAPHLRPLSSAGITRRLRSYGPLRHPDGPACPSRDSGWCVHTTDRASRVASIPLLHACRRHYPGGTGQCARRSLPSRWQPSPFYRRVGFRITRFEACSAFTKVAARMLAEPPMAALLIGVLQTSSLPPSPAPTATGWSDSCRAGFAPAEGRRLRTAHGKVGLTKFLITYEAHLGRTLASFVGDLASSPAFGLVLKPVPRSLAVPSGPFSGPRADRMRMVRNQDKIWPWDSFSVRRILPHRCSMRPMTQDERRQDAVGIPDRLCPIGFSLRSSVPLVPKQSTRLPLPFPRSLPPVQFSLHKLPHRHANGDFLHSRRSVLLRRSQCFLFEYRV